MRFVKNDRVLLARFRDRCVLLGLEGIGMSKFGVHSNRQIVLSVEGDSVAFCEVERARFRPAVCASNRVLTSPYNKTFRPWGPALRALLVNEWVIAVGEFV